MSASDNIIQSPDRLMDRTVSASVRRGVAEVLRNARKQFPQEEQPLPAKLQNLLNELRKRD